MNILFLEKYLLYKPDLFVHHFYTENTVFPGQFAKFSFKNIALDEKILDLDLEIISGHLHQPFKYKNYTCVGSFWNTSPLEENDTKVIFNYPNDFYQVVINPYISIDAEKYEVIDEKLVDKLFNENVSVVEKNLGSLIKKDNFEVKQFNLVIKTKNFKQAESILSKSLINKVRNIQYRQKTKKLGNILEQLTIDQDKLSFSFSSWQQLAKDYIKKKYPDNYQEYLEVAQELGVL